MQRFVRTPRVVVRPTASGVLARRWDRGTGTAVLDDLAWEVLQVVASSSDAWTVEAVVGEVTGGRGPGATAIPDVVEVLASLVAFGLVEPDEGSPGSEAAPR